MSKRAILIHRYPYRQVGEVLKRAHGWEIYGFSTHRLPEEQKSTYSGFLDLNTIIEEAKSKPSPENIYDACRSIEEEYDINLADVITSDRHLGLGWVTGGLYPGGRLTDLPYNRHLYIIERVFHALREFLEHVGPSLLISGGVGSAVGAIIYAVCERLSVPVVALSQGISKSYHYWDLDRYATVPGLEEAYQRNKAGPELSVDEPLRDVVVPGQDAVARICEQRKLSSHIRSIVRQSKIAAIGKIKGLKTVGEITLTEKLKYRFRLYMNFRRDMRREYASLSEAARSDYIYYPLHTEPEASLLGIEPHFTNQTYAIELLSKSVPAGVDVLVKEHWNAVGVRPHRWLDTIASFPRVKLVHPFENSIAIIRGCLATATIAGSAGAEAAIRGKPVISLGPNYRYNFVDHVFFENDLIRLRKLIKWIRDNRDSNDFARDGAALRQAFEAVCFNPGSDLSANPSPADVDLACNELLNLSDTGSEWVAV